LDGETVGSAPRDAGTSIPSRFGDYRIIREVGRGGMGVVYEAEQVSLGRNVAIKILPQQILRDDKHRHRFEREARAAAKLHHTNIVPVFGVGEQVGTPYYVMQFIQGRGLDEVLDELRQMKPSAQPASDAATAPVSTRAPARNSAAGIAHSLMSGR